MSDAPDSSRDFAPVYSRTREVDFSIGENVMFDKEA